MGVSNEYNAYGAWNCVYTQYRHAAVCPCSAGSNAWHTAAARGYRGLH